MAEYTFSTPILFYNADLFRQAGLDPDKPPRTWDEVDAAGKAIKEKTGKNGFFPGAYGPTDGTFVYQSLVMSNGGKVRDGNTLTFADKDAADAVYAFFIQRELCGLRRHDAVIRDLRIPREVLVRLGAR